MYYIQLLLANELDRCKGKGNSCADNHIKKMQDAYKNKQLDEEQLIVVNKGKQKEDWIQEKEVFLYKLYDISLRFSKPKTPEPTFF